MTRWHAPFLFWCMTALVVITAAPGLCTEANWWDDAAAEDPGYRVANYEEKFENEGIEEGSDPDCSWECYDSRSTDWYITETDADVKYKPEAGQYAHVANEGGAGSVEVTSTPRVYVHYWPGVLPTAVSETDTGTVVEAGDVLVIADNESWTPNEWVHGTIEITGGTGAGQSRTISNNDASYIIATEPWTTIPDETSTFSLTHDHTKRYRDNGYVWVYCKRPYDYCEPPAKCKKLWVLDCNLETTRGIGPGNSTSQGSPNNGDGSVPDRSEYDYSNTSNVLFVHYNDDDDDEDETPDREQGDVSGENDLTHLRFQFTQGIIALHNDAKQPDKGKVTLRVAGDPPDQYGDHPRVRVWKSATKGSEIQLTWDGTWYKKEYDLDQDWAEFSNDLLDGNRDKTLYVEGYEESTSLHDATIELEYELDCKVATDTVRATVLKVEILRGDVVEETGRGATGGPEEVLHPLDDDATYVSDPVPRVVLETVSVGTVSLNANDRLCASIEVSGYVTFALADIVPSNDADPTTAKIWVCDDEVGTASLSREAESTCLLRPYAAKYTFSKSLSAVPLASYDVPVVVTCEDAVTGNVGWDQAGFRVLATRNQTLPTDDDSDLVSELFLANGGTQPLKVKVDFGDAETLEELAQAGDDAIPAAVKLSCDDDEDGDTKDCGLDLPQGQNPLITSTDEELEIEMTDTSDLGLDPEVLGKFTALVRIPTLYSMSEEVEVVFEETAVGSNIFCTRYVEASLTFSAALDPEEPDTVAVQARKTLWDTVGDWESDDLDETGDDTKVFGTGDFVVEITETTGFRPWGPDAMTLAVTQSDLDLSEHAVDVVETGIDTKIFTTAQLTAAYPVTNDYADAWLEGPWQAGAVTHLDGREPGAYVPVMVRLSPIDDLLTAGLKVNVMGTEHSVIEQDDVFYSSGDPPKAGVFVAAGKIKVSSPFGAGHVTADETFIWAKLDGTMDARKETKVVYNTAQTVWDELLSKVVAQRRDARLGANPGQQYWGEKYDTDEAGDPRYTFASYVWEYFEEARGDAPPGGPPNPVTATVRKDALGLMCKDDTRSNLFQIPNTPDKLFVVAMKDKKIATTGCKYLLGHWKGSLGITWDFASQTQNVTDILHFNLGLGYGQIKGNILPLVTVLRAEYDTPDDRAAAIVDYLLGDGKNFLSKTQRDMIAKMGLKGPEAPKKLKVALYKALIHPNKNFKKMVDFAVLARTTMTALDAFLAYDIASGEALHVFGIDPFDDVIATDAGSRLGQELAGASTITTEAILRARIEEHFKQARKAFRLHKLNADKAKSLKAFHSVMLANDGKVFKPVKVIYHGGTKDIWRATLGTICQANKAKLKTKEGRKKFVDKVIETMGLAKLGVTEVDTTEAVLTPTDVKALHRMVEMLGFLNQDY